MSHIPRRGRLFSAKKLVFLTAMAFAMTSSSLLAGGTRVMYQSNNDLVVTGRSMDWPEDMQSNIWSLPRGMVRDGAAGPLSLQWTSRYGSVVVTSYDLGTVDGMNEHGLVANLMYSKDADYGTTENKPSLSLSLWAQYALDNFRTVREAVDALRLEPFRIVAPNLPNGRRYSFSLILSDAAGQSAIIEYSDGSPSIETGKETRVIVDTESYRQQIGQSAYWERRGNVSSMPGSSDPLDRYARASIGVSSMPKELDRRFALVPSMANYTNRVISNMLALVRSVSTPFYAADIELTPPTIWRSVANQKDKVYYFDSALVPSSFWFDLKSLDFSAGAAVKKLPISEGLPFSGNASLLMIESPPFQFLRADPFAAADALAMGSPAIIPLPSPKIEVAKHLRAPSSAQPVLAQITSAPAMARPPMPVTLKEPSYEEPVGVLREKVEIVEARVTPVSHPGDDTVYDPK